MKTKTPKVNDETSEVQTPVVVAESPEPTVELHAVVVEATEPVAELTDVVVETSAPVGEVMAETEPTPHMRHRTVRGVMLKPVQVVYHAGLGTVHLVVKGSKAVGTKSVKVVRRGKVAPAQATDGELNASEVQAVPEVVTPA